MEVIRLHSGDDHDEATSRASSILSQGGIVAFPTETVYALAARADLADAVEKLRSLKRRSLGKAFTVHVSGPKLADRYVPILSDLGRRLIRKAWPGPMTLIFSVANPSDARIMDGLNAGAASAMFFQGTVGLRCPDDPIAQSVLAGVDAPIVATSANGAGQQPPRSVSEFSADLCKQIDLLLDGGRSRYGRPSTIVRISESGYRIEREGVFDAGMVERMTALRLLLVCTGNTCRSPMAAGLARKMIANKLGCKHTELAAGGVHVTSAGTSGSIGGAATNAAKAMAELGIDLSDHTAISITKEMVMQADHVYVMTESHRQCIMGLAPSAADRIALLADDGDIVDPIGGTLADYQRCADAIEKGLQARLEEIEL